MKKREIVIIDDFNRNLTKFVELVTFDEDIEDIDKVIDKLNELKEKLEELKEERKNNE